MQLSNSGRAYSEDLLWTIVLYTHRLHRDNQRDRDL